MYLYFDRNVVVVGKIGMSARFRRFCRETLYDIESCMSEVDIEDMSDDDSFLCVL